MTITLGEAVINMSNTQSGYTPCACRDCMDTAITSDSKPALCLPCKGAGCEIHYGTGEGGTECQRDDAYGAEELCAADHDADTDCLYCDVIAETQEEA